MQAQPKSRFGRRLAIEARRGVKALIPSSVIAALRAVIERLDPVHLSYSQDGEDLVLRRVFESQATGFYVDVGAHHPRRFSNTFHFYRRGWSGINIEPNPEAIALFAKQRPRDVNLCMGIAERDGSLPYFMFDEPALNTFSAALAEERQRSTSYKLVGHREVSVRPLGDVLAENLAGRQIDFMTIDAEDYDLQVLQSNDWAKFRPACLLVEARAADLAELAGEPVHDFVTAQQYRLVAKTVNTLIYRDATQA